MVQQIKCNVCGKTLDPEKNEWKQVGFTSRQGLDVCLEHEDLIAFILDTCLSSPEIVEVWSNRFEETRKKVLAEVEKPVP